MLQAFLEQIKPLNDKLGETLYMRKIQVQDQSSTQIIDVKISYISHSGNRVTRIAGKIGFYRALGLMI